MKAVYSGRTLVLMIFILLAVGTVVGCGSASPTAGDGAKSASKDSADSTTTEKEMKPLEISIMIPSFYTETIKSDSPVLKELQNSTNTKLDLLWVPHPSYTDKLNALVAANDLPMAVMIENNRAGNILSATKAGAFWEVGKYMKDYPNLSKANPDIMKNVSVDGKVYGIYRKRAVARNGIIYRKDWLDNLGMKKPKTIDDVYEMLKAFTLKDPDKNGKNDTFGYSESSKLPYASTGEIFAWFGSPNRWGLADGKLVPDFMTPEYMNALKYLQKMYSEKLMNQDFAVTKDRYDNMNAGKVGAVIGALGDISSRFGNLYKLNPKAELDFTTSIDGVKGPRVMGGAGNGGLIMFPKSSVKTEAQLKQLLNFFDQLNNEQISKLLQFGIEGMHYKMVDGKVTVTAEQSKQMVADSQDLGQLKTLDLYDFPVSDPLKERIAKAFSDMEKIAVPNPTVPLQSPTQSKLGAQLDKIWQDAQIKFIMGASNENEYKQSIEQWRKQGGDKIIAEFSDDYAKSKGN